MIPKNLVAIYNSEVINPSLFIDAFGVTEDGVFATVERLKQEFPGRRITNGDVELVLLQYYAQEERPEGRSLDAVFAGLKKRNCLPPEHTLDRLVLQTLASRLLHAPGPLGEAWCYIYELTLDSTASRVMLRTRLQRAANDLHILGAKRKIYQDAADSLQ